MVQKQRSEHARALKAIEQSRVRRAVWSAIGEIKQQGLYERVGHKPRERRKSRDAEEMKVRVLTGWLMDRTLGKRTQLSVPMRELLNRHLAQSNTAGV